MQPQNLTPERLAAEFVEQYMEKLFYFCLKKTGNSYEAEDLTQEIALQVLTALQGGMVPHNFSAWVWQIARNRYSLWASRKHTRLENMLDCDLSDCEIVDESEGLFESVVHEERLSLLRRELAFIRSGYRDIVVAYYIDGQSLREIAERLSLPESAVKQRLYRARKIIQEGMEMAREFGVRSYKPDTIICNNICDRIGDHGQPHTLNEPKLNQNIFAVAYGTPQSAEDLAIEMGVSLPYMEDTLEHLTKETLLTKQNGKYETAFPIISRDAQEKMRDYFTEGMSRLVPPLEEGIDHLMAQYREAGLSYYGEYQAYEDAKWVILMLTYMGFYDTCSNTPKHRLGQTKRPDRGVWDIVGFEKTDIPNKSVGNHHHKNGFVSYRFAYAGIWGLTPDFLTEEETATIYAVAKGNGFFDKAVAENLVSYGYLRKEGNAYVPNLTVISDAVLGKFARYGKRKKHSTQFLEHAVARGRLNQEVLSVMAEMNHAVRKIVREDLPRSMRQDEKLLDGLVYALCRHTPALGYVIEQAISDGWLVYNEQTSRAIGAYLYIDD